MYGDLISWNSNQIQISVNVQNKKNCFYQFLTINLLLCEFFFNTNSRNGIILRNNFPDWINLFRSLNTVLSISILIETFYLNGQTIKRIAFYAEHNNDLTGSKPY